MIWRVFLKASFNIKSAVCLHFFRYAIGHAERSGPFGHTGWLAHLANATDQPYLLNKTYPGGPSIKVSNNYLNYFVL